MKQIYLLSLLFLSQLSVAQMTFSEPKVIPQSMKEKSPKMIAYNGGYKVFSIDKNSLNYNDLDLDLNVVKSGEVPLPSELEKPDVELLQDDKLQVMKIDNDLVLTVYELNLEMNEFEKVTSLDLGDAAEMNFGKFPSWMCDVREDGSYFLVASSGFRDNYGYQDWNLSVFSLSKNIDKVLWKGELAKPTFDKSSASARVSGIESLGSNEFIISYIGGISGNTKKNSNFQRFYKHDEDGIAQMWENESPWEVENDNVNGEVVGYLNESGEFEYLLPKFRNATSNKISVEVRNLNDELIRTYQTELVLPELTAKQYIDFSTKLLNDGKGQRILLQIEDGRKLKGKHPQYLVNLSIEDNVVNDSYLVNGESIELIRMPSPSKALNGSVLFYSGLMYLKDDNVQFIDPKEVFSNVNISGEIYQRIVNDKVFILYCEYSALRMKSEIVECKF